MSLNPLSKTEARDLVKKIDKIIKDGQSESNSLVNPSAKVWGNQVSCCCPVFVGSEYYFSGWCQQ